MPSAGQLRRADALSKVGMAAGLAEALVLATADVAALLAGGKDAELITRPLHGLLMLSIATQVICSVVVQVGVWVVRAADAAAAQVARVDSGGWRIPEGEPDNVRAFELGRRVERNGRQPG